MTVSKMRPCVDHYIATDTPYFKIDDGGFYVSWYVSKVKHVINDTEFQMDYDDSVYEIKEFAPAKRSSQTGNWIWPAIRVTNKREITK